MNLLTNLFGQAASVAMPASAVTKVDGQDPSEAKVDFSAILHGQELANGDAVPQTKADGNGLSQPASMAMTVPVPVPVPGSMIAGGPVSEPAKNPNALSVSPAATIVAATASATATPMITTTTKDQTGATFALPVAALSVEGQEQAMSDPALLTVNGVGADHVAVTKNLSAIMHGRKQQPVEEEGTSTEQFVTPDVMAVPLPPQWQPPAYAIMEGEQSQPSSDEARSSSLVKAGEATSLLVQLRAAFAPTETPATSVTTLWGQPYEPIVDPAVSVRDISAMSAPTVPSAANVHIPARPDEALNNVTTPALAHSRAIAPESRLATVTALPADNGGVSSASSYQAVPVTDMIPAAQAKDAPQGNGSLAVNASPQDDSINIPAPTADTSSGLAQADEGAADMSSSPVQIHSAQPPSGDEAIAVSVSPAVPAASTPMPAVNAMASVGAALNQQVVDLGISGQWIDDVAREIARIGDNPGQGSFRLASPNLGSVKVDITAGVSGTDIHMFAETEAGVAALRKEQGRLMQDADLAALRIGDVRIDRAVSATENARNDNQTGNQNPQGQNGNQALANQNGGQGNQHSGRQDMAGMNDGNSREHNAKNPFTGNIMGEAGGGDAHIIRQDRNEDGDRYA